MVGNQDPGKELPSFAFLGTRLASSAKRKAIVRNDALKREDRPSASTLTDWSYLRFPDKAPTLAMEDCH